MDLLWFTDRARCFRDIKSSGSCCKFSVMYVEGVSRFQWYIQKALKVPVLYP
jgi:hypothetical protein